MARPIPFGKYYLLDRINVGGMAEVFRAKAFGVEGFERIVAVKRILPSVAEDNDFITMFIDEAKIAVQLSHANIAGIFDLGKVGESYFIALEYVHGKDVRALFDYARARDERLPVPLSCYVMMKVCEGLDYAHNKRDASGRSLDLVHRDVSPQNLLVSFDGEVKLIDFGIAKAAGKAGRTEAGVLKGKFGYLSPEQVRGESIDRRSDVFGAGIVLHELLTGERLFAGDSDFSTIEKLRSSELKPPSASNPGVPPELDEIVMRALSRNFDERYQTAMELHDELQRFMFAQGVTFSRRELSAWMRESFPDDAEPDENDSSSTGAARPDPTDVSPLLEPVESNAVITDTSASQGEQPTNKSTMVGMPAAPTPQGRSVPPPPPRPDASSPPGARSVPPPPRPRTLPPGAQPGLPLAPGSVIPSVLSASVPPRARSVPPPPPPSAIPNRPTPRSGVSAAILAASTPATEPTPAPLAPGQITAPPALDMDWDDDELSTQIYDRPEEQLGLSTSGTFEHVTSGFEEVPAEVGQANIATYVPPMSASAANGRRMPSNAPGPSFAAAAPAPQAAPARVAPVAQPISSQHGTTSDASRAIYLALAVLLFVAASIGVYIVLAPDQPGIVHLTTHPADATVLFDGEPVGSLSPFIRTGVTPGEKHVLEVKKEGYLSWSQEVQVQPGQTLELPITLQSDAQAPAGEAAAAGATAQATGGFSLESVPAGAKVYLDGAELGGLTPLRVANLLPRAYEVTLKAADYRDHTTRVEVRSGIDVALPKVVLQPERLQVRISSEPPGDVTLIRGQERRVLGRSPLTVSIDNGEPPWTVEVLRDGFEPFSQVIVSSGSASMTINATLLRAAPVREERPAPRPRVERVERRKPAPVARPAPAEPAAPAPAPAVATGSGPGTLRVNSRPWSQVYVDGRLVGNTPQMAISLEPGTHRVTLTNPDFGLKKNLTVEIRPGQTETQIIDLQ